VKLQDKDGKDVVRQVMYESVEEDKKAKYQKCSINMKKVDARNIDSIFIKLWAKYETLNTKPED